MCFRTKLHEWTKFILSQNSDREYIQTQLRKIYNYPDTVIFKPTLFNHFCENENDAIDYFKFFIKKNWTNITFDEYSNVTKNNITITNGKYTFENANNRITAYYVFGIDERGKITLHHSELDRSYPP